MRHIANADVLPNFCGCYYKWWYSVANGRAQGAKIRTIINGM